MILDMFDKTINQMGDVTALVAPGAKKITGEILCLDILDRKGQLIYRMLPVRQDLIQLQNLVFQGGALVELVFLKIGDDVLLRPGKILQGCGNNQIPSNHVA